MKPRFFDLREADRWTEMDGNGLLRALTREAYILIYPEGRGFDPHRTAVRSSEWQSIRKQ